MEKKEALRRFLDAVKERKDTEEMFLEAAQETVRRIGGSFMPFEEAELPFIIIALTMLEKDIRGKYPEAAEAADSVIGSITMISVQKRMEDDG
ncbi:MAG: hypothetical protein PUD44_10945 [Clostridiaceae bacterium]|nr:hypothetical protein [Clostridiaceae bacterium]